MNCCDIVQGDCKKNGLQGIKSEHKSKIICQNTRYIEYSIDIDNCCESIEPNAPRWDYVVSYGGKCLFVEFHDASTPGAIRDIDKKLQWLRNKLQECTMNIGNSSFHWIATGKISNLLSKNSKYQKQLDLLRRKKLQGPEKVLRCE